MACSDQSTSGTCRHTRSARVRRRRKKIKRPAKVGGGGPGLPKWAQWPGPRGPARPTPHRPPTPHKRWSCGSAASHPVAQAIAARPSVCVPRPYVCRQLTRMQETRTHGRPIINPQAKPPPTAAPAAATSRRRRRLPSVQAGRRITRSTPQSWTARRRRAYVHACVHACMRSPAAFNSTANLPLQGEALKPLHVPGAQSRASKSTVVPTHTPAHAAGWVPLQGPRPWSCLGGRRDCRPGTLAPSQHPLTSAKKLISPNPAPGRLEARQLPSSGCIAAAAAAAGRRAAPARRQCAAAHLRYRQGLPHPRAPLVAQHTAPHSTARHGAARPAARSSPFGCCMRPELGGQTGPSQARARRGAGQRQEKPPAHMAMLPAAAAAALFANLTLSRRPRGSVGSATWPSSVWMALSASVRFSYVRKAQPLLLPCVRSVQRSGGQRAVVVWPCEGGWSRRGGGGRAPAGTCCAASPALLWRQAAGLKSKPSPQPVLLTAQAPNPARGHRDT